MPAALPIDTDELVRFLTALLNTPSPSGRALAAMALVEQALHEIGLPARRTLKGGLVAEWAGAAQDAPRALTAHVDTLGAMVRQIKPNGRLRLTQIGGYAWNTIEGEGCTVLTAAGRSVRGSVLLTKASAHVFGKAVGETARDEDSLEVRLDERTTSEQETRALGVEVGDVVALDPRLEAGPAGFIRSRHLDDKAGVACVLAAARALRQAGLQPAQRTFLHFSNYEETGHGAASGIPPEAVELVAVDMAAVGEGQASDEFHATLCAKDSRGPYDEALSRRLIDLAAAAGIPVRVDIYPHYGSDAEAYWWAGGAAPTALIGPGIDASHNLERTHIEALVATAQWIAEYLRHP